MEKDKHIKIIILLGLLCLGVLLSIPIFLRVIKEKNIIVEEIESADKRFSLECIISKEILHVRIKNSGNNEIVYFLDTRASSHSKWSIKWINEKEIFFSSSDIGSIDIFFDGDKWKSSID